MISLLIFGLLSSHALGAKLDNTKLPPSNAGTAGGVGAGISPPFGGPRGAGYSGGPGAPGFPGGPGVPAGPGTPVNDGFQPLKHSGPIIPIISQTNYPNPGDGSNSWSYESSNGIQANEESYLKSPGSDVEAQFFQGGFSYTSPEGQNIRLQYTADENGFNPVGSHLPTPPPIPPETLEALEKNAADEAAGIYDDGKYKPDGSGQYKPEGGVRGGGGYRPDGGVPGGGRYRPNRAATGGSDLMQGTSGFPPVPPGSVAASGGPNASPGPVPHPRPSLGSPRPK